MRDNNQKLLSSATENGLIDILKQKVDVFHRLPYNTSPC